jgi:transcriptional regulator with GAF, ATPase, and Fis domain
MSDTPSRPEAQLLEALRAVLAQVAEPSQVLKTILGQAVSQTGADRGLFVEIDRSGKWSYRVLYRYRKDEVADQGHFSRSVFKQVLDKGTCVRLENALDDPKFMTRESIQDYRFVSVLCAPIRVEGRVSALVHLESNRPGHFKEGHEALLDSLLEIAAPALGALQASEGVMRDQTELRQVREELADSREFLAREWSFGRYIGKSEAVRELEKTVRKASQTDFPVLLLGETGTGKTILARVLHHSGPRAKHPLVTVFSPSLEKGMVESELFGHKRGAFTGAVVDQIGKVQAADKGTLFLDEIGELPLEIQPKLLRLLQEKTYERVGDPTERKADVRVIAATNRDLRVEVRAGRFRRDLYERLNFVPIEIPPLRKRREDIPLLLRHCLDQTETGRWIEITPDAERYLRELPFNWAGNVRHLEHLAARLAMEAPQRPVSSSELAELLDTSDSSAASLSGETPSRIDLEIGLPALLDKEEKKWLEEALARHPELTRAELAAKLKISEAQLYKKLKQYGIGR